jgi:hypothetical protein
MCIHNAIGYKSKPKQKTDGIEGMSNDTIIAKNSLMPITCCIHLSKDVPLYIIISFVSCEQARLYAQWAFKGKHATQTWSSTAYS